MVTVQHVLEAPRLLEGVVHVLASPVGDAFATLLPLLSELIPHRCHSLLAAEHPMGPMVIGGEPEFADRVMSGELVALLNEVPRGSSGLRQALYAGTERTVFAASSDQARSSSMLVLLPRDPATIDDATCGLVHALLDTLTLQYGWRLTAADPGYVGAARAAAGERARAISELTDLHGAALTTIVTTLRSHRLDDTTARVRATEQATEALLQLHAVYDRERKFSEEHYDELSRRMRAELPALVQHTDVRLELAEAAAGPALPSEIAYTTRALARGVVLTMLGKEAVTRIRVDWATEGDELVLTIRDDGPDPLAAEALAVHGIEDRLHAVSGRSRIEDVPGWGSVLRAWMPLGRVPSTTLLHHPLNTLNPREVEVLQRIARGLRNHAIADELHISEHTVKFHVRNLLKKLSVDSRAEAAALANRVRLDLAKKPEG